MEKNDNVDLSLTSGEALVLFEFLSRFGDKEQLAIEDEAERQVLWNLCCMLQRELVAPFDSNYDSLLEDARATLRPPPG